MVDTGQISQFFPEFYQDELAFFIAEYLINNVNCIDIKMIIYINIYMDYKKACPQCMNTESRLCCIISGAVTYLAGTACWDFTIACTC